MKNLLVVVALLIAACHVDLALSAEASDLAELREQLRELTRRVERLEQENASLRAQQTPAPASVPAAAAATREASGPTTAPSMPGWISRVAVKGDVRYRHQQTDDERASAQREEHLVRARLNVEAKLSDVLTAAMGFATTENGNPRGANARLDNEFSRKSLDLDLAYLDWTFAPGAHAIGGKMRMPFVRPGQSLFWDNDVNPEGIAVTYRGSALFGSAYGFWIDENVASTESGATPADTTDTRMFGAQVGSRFGFGESTLVLAGMYYDLAAAQGRRPFYNNSPNGNSLDLTGGLAYDFRVIEAMAELNTQLGVLPMQLWLDAARNMDADLDTAFGAGVMFGKASDVGSWEAGLAYQSLDKDALFAQFVDSDFGAGLTDTRGWILRAGYVPHENVVLNATYFGTQGNVERGDEFDFERLLLDVGVRF